MAGRKGVAARQMQKVPEPMEQVSEEPSKKRPWEKVDEDGNTIKIKRKKVPGAKNSRIRKHVQPRNACQCLHEIVASDNIVYANLEQEGTGHHSVSVTVDGDTFHGSGQSQKIARQNAAEAALVSFVKPPMPKEKAGEDNEMEDKTPWAPLASFAMYKLFMDWNEGRIGIGNARIMQGSFNQKSVANSDTITQYLPATVEVKSPERVKNGKLEKGATDHILRPAKQVPDNAAAMHPVMILNQMRPGVEYTSNKTEGDDNKPYYFVSASIDGQEFTGEGVNPKKAKFSLAKDAIFSLFGVESCFELPG